MTQNLKAVLKKPLVLTGMMGSGKSHVGRALARELGIDFHDSDSLIEKKAGRTIAEIFEQFGEQKFRDAEKNTILEVLDLGEPCVLATGGGAVANPQTLEAFTKKSVNIWLRADLDTIWRRVKDNPGRPLLKADNPQAVLEKLMSERAGMYAQAHIIVDITPDSVRQTTQDVIKALSAHLIPGRA